MNSEISPWENDGRPSGLTEAHFDAAARVAITCLREDVADGDRIEPALGESMAYFRLSGTHYEHNHQRIVALLASRPLAVDVRGRPFYAAILVTDPSETQEGLHPIGVVTSTGYVGSVWNANGLVGYSKVDRGLRLRRFLATRLYVEQHEYGCEAKVWVWTALTR